MLFYHLILYFLHVDVILREQIQYTLKRYNYDILFLPCLPFLPLLLSEGVIK